MLFDLKRVSKTHKAKEKAKAKQKPSKSQTIKKMDKYCSVCHGAGKPKAEYTSHYLRESKAPGAKTTCPYLLSITCGYCKGKGHTPKYCPVAAEKKKAAQGPSKAVPSKAGPSKAGPSKAPAPAPAPAVPAPPATILTEQDYPAIGTRIYTRATAITGWSAIVTKAPMPKAAAAAEAPMPKAETTMPKAEAPMPTAVKPTFVEETYIGTCGYSWADL